MSITVTRNDTEPLLTKLSSVAVGEPIALDSTAYLVLGPGAGGSVTLFNPSNGGQTQVSGDALVRVLVAEITFSNP